MTFWEAARTLRLVLFGPPPRDSEPSIRRTLRDGEAVVHFSFAGVSYTMVARDGDCPEPDGSFFNEDDLDDDNFVEKAVFVDFPSYTPVDVTCVARRWAGPRADFYRDIEAARVPHCHLHRALREKHPEIGTEGGRLLVTDGDGIVRCYDVVPNATTCITSICNSSSENR